MTNSPPRNRGASPGGVWGRNTTQVRTGRAQYAIRSSTSCDLSWRWLFADCDPCVRHIVAQPFLLWAAVDQKLRKHIPDYLLITDTGPVVVDVKPGRHLAEPNGRLRSSGHATLSRPTAGAMKWRLNRRESSWRISGSYRAIGAYGYSPRTVGAISRAQSGWCVAR